jgi:ribosomal protein L11 methyltransferase
VYRLSLTCSAAEAELIIAELWESGTLGIREQPQLRGIEIDAFFETSSLGENLIHRLARFSPTWEIVAATDWVAETYRAWPARAIGNRIFLAPAWSDEPTPPGRLRVIHNPGLACGTGEHPCTRLALMALEELLFSGANVADIGTGSGILAVGAMRLGARSVIGVDNDESALAAARENFALNRLEPMLAAGSTECIRNAHAGLTIANINAELLAPLVPDLFRITAPGGWIVITGFTEQEQTLFREFSASAAVTSLDGWLCLSVPVGLPG